MRTWDLDREPPPEEISSPLRMDDGWGYLLKYVPEYVDALADGVPFIPGYQPAPHELKRVCVAIHLHLTVVNDLDGRRYDIGEVQTFQEHWKPRPPESIYTVNSPMYDELEWFEWTV
jgi:hypothetical protein